jgi:hypothetical protein
MTIPLSKLIEELFLKIGYMEILVLVKNETYICFMTNFVYPIFFKIKQTENGIPVLQISFSENFYCFFSYFTIHFDKILSKVGKLGEKRYKTYVNSYTSTKTYCIDIVVIEMTECKEEELISWFCDSYSNIIEKLRIDIIHWSQLFNCEDPVFFVMNHIANAFTKNQDEYDICLRKWEYDYPLLNYYIGDMIVYRFLMWDKYHCGDFDPEKGIKLLIGIYYDEYDKPFPFPCCEEITTNNVTDEGTIYEHQYSIDCHTPSHTILFINKCPISNGLLRFEDYPILEQFYQACINVAEQYISVISQFKTYGDERLLVDHPEYNWNKKKTS